MGRSITDKILNLAVPGYLLLSFVYILLVIQPPLYFHQNQTPFMLSADFLLPYLGYPGGPAELLAGFVMQAFYSPVAGPLVFFVFGFFIYILCKRIMDHIYPNRLNKLWALIPYIFSLTLVNNYNFPYSILISFILVLLFSLFLLRVTRRKKSALQMVGAASVLIYYISGSGYLLLFTLISLLILFHARRWKSGPEMINAVVLTVLIPWMARTLIFRDTFHEPYPAFFPEKVFFRNYFPSAVFYLLLISMPLLIAASLIDAGDKRIAERIKLQGKMNMISAMILVVVLGLSSHLITYVPDAKKIARSDYYCYHLDADKVYRAATGIDNYSFSANVNYNLAMAKAGRLNRDVFKFFQVRGFYALYPDVEFSAEMAFISADFYYDLGYIPEARHWAYEALVFYPNSPRAHRLLVKIHLVTGEYRAAARSLHVLDKGIINRSFVRQYQPFIDDTTRVMHDTELAGKRSSMPGAHELNPYIQYRFLELMDVNSNNKRAYEYYMLYCLLDGDFENFLEGYKHVNDYFNEPQEIYEEALLMYDFLHNRDVSSAYDISSTSQEAFDRYMEILNEHRGDKRRARNVLYWEMGKTCMYYLQFVEPRIVLPELTDPDHEEPQI